MGFENRFAGKDGGELIGGQCAENCPPTCGEMCGHAHADVGGIGGGFAEACFDDVEHVAALKHGHMRDFANSIRETFGHALAEASERSLPGVAEAEFIGGWAKAVGVQV